MTDPATQHYRTDKIDRRFIAASRDFLYPHVRGSVLNVGLGYGAWDERLSEHRDGNVVGLDFSEGLVNDFSARYPRIQYVCMDVFDYRPEQRFDTIVASHFLEHVEDARGLLQRISSWLKPGGRALVVVPNANSLHRRIGCAMGLLNHVTDLNDGDRLLGHVRVYTPELLREHFSGSGLRIDELQGVTVKALSNAQLASMPPAYVDACCAMLDSSGEMAGQLAVVASRRDRQTRR